MEAVNNAAVKFEKQVEAWATPLKPHFPMVRLTRIHPDC
jgi:hypothetical protein